jgi:hypothetical protein
MLTRIFSYQSKMNRWVLASLNFFSIKRLITKLYTDEATYHHNRHEPHNSLYLPVDSIVQEFGYAVNDGI